MQFNQINRNKGDVNNAIAANGNVSQAVGNTGETNNVATEGGTVAQATGRENSVKVEQPKENFWSQVGKKLTGLWKKIIG